MQSVGKRTLSKQPLQMHIRKNNQSVHHSVLQEMQNYFHFKLYKSMQGNFFNQFSMIDKDDKDRIFFTSLFQQMIDSNKQQKIRNQKNQKFTSFDPKKLGLSLQQSRGIGCMLGMAISDALGSCTEFQEYQPKGYTYIKDGFEDVKQAIKRRDLSSRHGDITIWTDDASMGLAMANSLLVKNFEFNPIHIRYMFILWLYHGLGNGGRKRSIGLGGNISISIYQFMDYQSQYTKTGNQFNNGNGSLMRLAPIPVAFHYNKQEAMKYSQYSSLTTHNGLQAKQCCRLLAAIIVELINRQQKQNQSENTVQKMDIQNMQQEAKLPKWKRLLQRVCNEFTSNIESVNYLAKSQQQPSQLYVQLAGIKLQTQNPQLYKISKQRYELFRKFNPKQSDRNWNWKSSSYTYCRSRWHQQPGYIGSYCMDALAMALHTVWITNSFKQCAVMNANLGGDCDTVGSIAGQIAGAAYGIDSDMLRLYSEMDDVTKGRYEIFLVGYKLMTTNKKNKIEKNEYEKEEQRII